MEKFEVGPYKHDISGTYTAVSAPTLGRVFYIGDFRVGQEEMRAFYRMYLIVMISLFVGSFFVPKK